MAHLLFFVILAACVAVANSCHCQHSDIECVCGTDFVIVGQVTKKACIRQEFEWNCDEWKYEIRLQELLKSPGQEKSSTSTVDDLTTHLMTCGNDHVTIYQEDLGVCIPKLQLGQKYLLSGPVLTEKSPAKWWYDACASYSVDGPDMEDIKTVANVLANCTTTDGPKNLNS